MGKSELRASAGESTAFATAVAEFIQNRCDRRQGSGLTWQRMDSTAGANSEIAFEAQVGKFLVRISEFADSAVSTDAEGYLFQILDAGSGAVVASAADWDLSDLFESAEAECDKQMREPRQQFIEAIAELG